MTTPITIFGAPVGLYTGKVRCYLRKNGIAYIEALPSDERFQKIILPAIGRFMNPVLLTPEGEIVQDTTDIIDWCERNNLGRHPVYPATPLQRLVALTLDLFGGEGLLRAAMHYRWSYRSYQEEFLQHEFGLSMRAAGATDAEMQARMNPMLAYFNSYLPLLGITPETVPAVEASYEAVMKLLDTHFRHHPYAMGGRPTCADYGLIAPLWAHLGRDPYPADMMKRRAPSLYRWVERMQANDPDMPEFPAYPQDLPEDDGVAETLAPILHHMATDYLPELEMNVRVINAWLDANPVSEGERARTSREERGFGSHEFLLRGQPVKGLVSPYRMYMVQRVSDAFANLPPAAQSQCESYFKAAGLDPLLRLRARRRIERSNHLEVWGAVV